MVYHSSTVNRYVIGFQSNTIETIMFFVHFLNIQNYSFTEVSMKLQCGTVVSLKFQ